MAFALRDMHGSAVVVLELLLEIPYVLNAILNTHDLYIRSTTTFFDSHLPELDGMEECLNNRKCLDNWISDQQLVVNTQNGQHRPEYKEAPNDGYKVILDTNNPSVLPLANFLMSISSESVSYSSILLLCTSASHHQFTAIQLKSSDDLKMMGVTSIGIIWLIDIFS